ncbi:MAG: hypothetical protein EBY21_06320 [Alphaproteobacteria bacterium]|nr:hypothetical protein [Alphaproteobacteria bacterium]
MSQCEAERQLRLSLIVFSVLVIGCGLIALGQTPVLGQTPFLGQPPVLGAAKPAPLTLVGQAQAPRV